MARLVNGSYQPRCAIADPDAAFNEETSLPRRMARRSRFVRGGIALGAAGIVGALAIITPGLAQSAAASNSPATTVVGEADSTIRVGTTDAFVTRGTSTDRDTAREELAVESVSEAASQRATALDAVGEKVADATASVAAQARTATLTNTGTAIDAEAERVASIKFFWPTEGEINSPWGPRLHPILRYTRLHGGADIGGAVGAPIYAVADGVVTKAAQGYNGGSGNNVRIDHGKMDGEAIETSYLHMHTIDVRDGEKVKKGQKIGTVGNTGLSTAPHLHFSVYVNGANSDPAPYLNAGRN